MAYGNNLYPPIVASSMPAFLINSADGCKLYFSFSSYNSYDDVAFIQISVKHYKTNYSIFQNETGIIAVKRDDVHVDPNIKTNFKYYINLTNDLVNNNFKVGELYKVQLRLVGNKGIRQQILSTTDASLYSTSLKTVYDDIDFYSEWSTVCVIKPISDITVQFCNLTENGIPHINQKVNLIGKIVFADSKDTESLSNYRIRIFYYTDDEKTNPLADSGILIPASENDIYYVSPIEFYEGESYTIELTYTTLNGYTESKDYSFFKVNDYNDKLDIVLKTELDNDNGRIKILFYQEEYQEYKD